MIRILGIVACCLLALYLVVEVRYRVRIRHVHRFGPWCSNLHNEYQTRRCKDTACGWTERRNLQ
jgi:hypothetical protein